MRRGSEQVQDRQRWIVERAIVLQILSGDRGERWSRAELAAELAGVEAAVLDCALTRLQDEGVLRRSGSEVQASRAVRHIDTLELIGV
ncbi:MAG TPA: hypothetical protein VGL57_04635 [Solirubrobacteraceae bacterium]|jgi:hypothetical protein